MDLERPELDVCAPETDELAIDGWRGARSGCDDDIGAMERVRS
jgi:hypothetical protein